MVVDQRTKPLLGARILAVAPRVEKPFTPDAVIDWLVNLRAANA